MIRFANVSKLYDGKPALENINLEINAGEMVFLTGHSGAGKTTLLELIAQVERADRGQIYINDRNINQLPPRKLPFYRRHIGMIFQNPELLPNRTVFDNVALPLTIVGIQSAEIKRRVRAALSKVGLLDRENVFPNILSSGEQQRVGIARAVVNKPVLLLADEPTGNLDPDLSRDIMRLFEAFNAVGVTVLIATHDLALIARMRHRIITLKQGHLINGSLVDGGVVNETQPV